MSPLKIGRAFRIIPLLGFWSAGVMSRAEGNSESPPTVPGKEGASTFSQNEIIVLPKVLVRPTGEPVFGEYEVFSKSGLDALLAKRYPGAGLKHPPEGMDNYAKLMYADDRRLGRLAHYKDVARTMLEIGDVSGSKELSDEVNDAFLRRPTWRERAMDRNLNSNRR